MHITALDHLVLTVRDIEVTSDFYTSVLGMHEIRFGDNRVALVFGRQKINLHQAGNEFEPKAAVPTPGSADLCFLTDTPIDEVIAHISRLVVDIVDGPIQRNGATGPIISVYIRDPDGNLIEISRPLPDAASDS